MNNEELEILDYLETAYTGARMSDDVSAMVRISRAIAAFKADPRDASEAVFSENFVLTYSMPYD